MQAHTKQFMAYWDYGEQDFIPCMICSSQAVDLHHIIKRSAGGKDTPNNIIPLCRNHHNQAHGICKSNYILSKDFLQLVLNKHITAYEKK